MAQILSAGGDWEMVGVYPSRRMAASAIRLAYQVTRSETGTPPRGARCTLVFALSIPPPPAKGYL